MINCLSAVFFPCFTYDNNRLTTVNLLIINDMYLLIYSPKPMNDNFNLVLELKIFSSHTDRVVCAGYSNKKYQTYCLLICSKNFDKNFVLVLVSNRRKYVCVAFFSHFFQKNFMSKHIEYQCLIDEA